MWGIDAEDCDSYDELEEGGVMGGAWGFGALVKKSVIPWLLFPRGGLDDTWMFWWEWRGISERKMYVVRQ